MFAFGLQNVSAQDGIKIITNHPDFKIKVSVALPVERRLLSILF